MYLIHRYILLEKQMRVLVSGLKPREQWCENTEIPPRVGIVPTTSARMFSPLTTLYQESILKQYTK